MAATGEKEKKEIIETYKIHENDKGSSEVQIAVLTHRINHIVEHLKNHKKDHHTRRGLLIMVGRRKRLLKYLKKKNLESFKDLTKKLKIKVKD